jgi:hypothetical protein
MSSPRGVTVPGNFGNGACYTVHYGDLPTLRKHTPNYPVTMHPCYLTHLDAQRAMALNLMIRRWYGRGDHVRRSKPDLTPSIRSPQTSYMLHAGDPRTNRQVV